MKPRFAHRWVPLVAAGLLLTGCGLSDPGAAAEVGDQKISAGQVQDLTDAYCAVVAQQVATGQGMPSSLAVQKQAVVQLLAQAAVVEQAVDERGITVPGEVTQYFYAPRKPLVDLVEDTDQREQLRDLFEVLARVQAGGVALAADDAGVDITTQNLDQLSAAGQQLLPDLIEQADVSVDPRYDLGSDLTSAGGDGSVSEPVSDLAVQLVGGSDDTAPSAAGLPPSQRCGG